jgi:hypothetical protein
MLDLLIHQYLVSGMMHNFAHDMSKLVHLGFPKSKVDSVFCSLKITYSFMTPNVVGMV